MSFEVSVGPPILTINQGNTFMVTELSGEIESDTECGVFWKDTRFVSHYKIYANGKSWTTLSSAQTSYFSSRIYLTNQSFLMETGEVAAGTLAMTMDRSVGEAIDEEMEIANYDLQPVRLNLEIALRSDFADIFEVRSGKFYRRGRIETVWHQEQASLRMIYRSGDFYRELIYRPLGCKSLVHYANGRVVFELQIEPGETWTCHMRYDLMDRDSKGILPEPQPNEQSKFQQLQLTWEAEATKLTSSNEETYRLFRQSVQDIGALRFYHPDSALNVWVPAAGVPWYVTVFGRDSLIASLQSLMVNPRLALGALRALSDLQATGMDDWRDAEPGKIAHEMRYGELAYFNKIPHTPYYGTADATTLFLIVLHETWKWTGDIRLIENYKAVAERCLAWIDNYGDLDGDGFQEYKTRSTDGYENMCWKDSPNSIMYPDGSLVLQPKAVCELQGYVFDAWMRSAEMFDAIGEIAFATKLRQKASRLQVAFENAFWCEDLGFYALALDPQKEQVKTLASNAGHLLWSGICSPEHAARLIDKLMQPEFWTGWGIRTLSAQSTSYNPNSYHNGSVWPHDNGLIALGCKRYGYSEQASAIARDISRAASYFLSHRLPELYAGIARTPNSFPVQYVKANIPQAWAAGSAFHLLQAILGFQADAPNGLLYVDPVLPKWLADVNLRSIRVGESLVDLSFWKDANGVTQWNSSVSGGNIKVEQRSWTPWVVPQVPPESPTGI